MRYRSLIIALTMSVGFVVGLQNPALATHQYNHRGDFLTNPTCPLGTTGYPNASPSDRTTCRNGIKARNYTHQYVSITSSEKNWFADPAGFKSRLRELKNDGIHVVVFLTSDTGNWKDKSISAIKADLTEFIPQIDSLVTSAGSYSLGIEIDEYWTLSQAKQIGDHLQTLTTKAISAHERGGKWDYCKGQSWCDYMILQYGFGKTEAQIRTMTQNAIADLGSREVVAGEYNVSHKGSESSVEEWSVKLGNAAKSAGAWGFGNGGTL